MSSHILQQRILSRGGMSQICPKGKKNMIWTSDKGQTVTEGVF